MRLDQKKQNQLLIKQRLQLRQKDSDNLVPLPKAVYVDDGAYGATTLSTKKKKPKRSDNTERDLSS